MKISAINAHAKRSKSNGNIPTQTLAKTNAYQSDSISFGGASGLKRAADSITSAVSGIIQKNQIMNYLKSLKNKDSYMGDCFIEARLEDIEKNIDAQTAPFVQKLTKLIERTQDNTGFNVDLGFLNTVATHYKKNIQSRPLMEKVVDSKKFDLWSISNEGIFGNKYKGSEVQNKLIESMLNMKDRTFSGSAFYYAEEFVTPKNYDFIQKLLTQKKASTKSVDIEKLAEIITQEQDVSKIAQRRSAEAVIETEPEFLIGNSGCYLDSILKNHSPQMTPMLEKVLPKVQNESQLITFMQNYKCKPEVDNFCEKALKAVENGNISMWDFTNALKYASKS